MRHEYFAALHESESAYEQTGWMPQFLTLERDGELHAACPLYLKHHSYGEYVFDWAWAEAYHRHGLRYYPKLLNTVPFTPVPGPRLLARDAAARELLLHAMVLQVQETGLSSAHVLFLGEEDRAAATHAGWMMRSTVQFHWANDGYADFEAFLARLSHQRRKNIRQERRRVREAGVTFRWLEGAAIGARDWEFFSFDLRNGKKEVVARGGDGSVVNEINGESCLGCHSGAEQKWDLICEKGHGCDPLGVPDSLIEQFQDSDPSCPPPAAL